MLFVLTKISVRAVLCCIQQLQITLTSVNTTRMVYILYVYVGKYIAITQSPHADHLQVGYRL